ncbi:competence protein CoiA [Sporosarcina sp. NCCP-2222]|uniref:competence protein CoiA n=1 Tax=Sporosarcina sp. NCCP-2222 TaxID=2935073 RepID=UPI0020BDB80F|nr:competence protein CoiA family protein [Sporosarcina sp. NCCP-2222]
MLSARTGNGQLFILSADMPRSQLKQLRASERFFCPECGSALQLKVGDIVIPHFAHFQEAHCTSAFSEGESAEHVNGKQQLYRFLCNLDFQVVMEPLLPALSQRPDLLVQHLKTLTPIEFQCSRISQALMEERTKGYQKAGMEPIWILHTPAKLSKLPLGVNVFRFSKFEEQFFTTPNYEHPFLLTYNTYTQTFHYYSNLLPVDGERYIGVHTKLPITYQCYPFALPKSPAPSMLTEYLSCYVQLRDHYIRSRIQYNRQGIHHPFLRCCYELRIPPVLLPNWIGVPVQTKRAFRVHDCEWQLCLLYELAQKGVAFNEVSATQLEHFCRRYGGEPEDQIIACRKYFALLMENGIHSFQNHVELGENKILRLISERFLAKRV